MSLAEVARRVLPGDAYRSLVRLKHRLDRARVARLMPRLGEREFSDILAGPLSLSRGDTVFVHSAIDRLNLDFPFYKILALLRDAVGPGGTLLFPTYPNRQISSYEYLLQKPIFDVRRTPSYAGLLTEFARRRPDSVRSLHPSKPVCAAGPLARELTATHQLSPYPYDRCSPFYKLIGARAKIVGLGVATDRITFGYCVEDALKEEFPVRTYHEELFEVPCVNYDGRTEIVRTYAQDMSAMARHDGPAFMRAHVSREACEDLRIGGAKFFRADAALLFDEMLRLARRGVTAYSRSGRAKRSAGAFVE